MTPDPTELARVLAARLRTRMSEPVDWKLYTDAADALEKLAAEVERLTKERDEARASDAESLWMYHSARDRAEKTKEDLDEARKELDEALAMTAREDVIQKAKALDELEAYLRSDAVRGVWIEPRAEEEDAPVYFALCIDCKQIDAEGPTIAAAIRAALAKATQ